MCQAHLARGSDRVCDPVAPDGATEGLPWVARFVARTRKSDSSHRDSVIVATSTTLGHRYLARAVFDQPRNRSTRVNPKMLGTPNYDLAFPTEAMAIELARIGFDPLRLALDLGDAAAAGAAIHLEVAGSRIGSRPHRSRTAAAADGWVQETDWQAVRATTRG